MAILNSIVKTKTKIYILRYVLKNFKDPGNLVDVDTLSMFAISFHAVVVMVFFFSFV